MIFIKQFGELGSSDIDQAGGKAANLGELTRAGLPVPPGFVVLTEAYSAYIAEHQLNDHITALAAASDDPAGYDDASAQISGLFGDEVSNTLRTEIAEAYATLGKDVPVAVRSSATAEDLPEASFAGQQETYLNVRGPDDLLVAVRECWASLWTGARHGLPGPSGHRSAGRQPWPWSSSRWSTPMPPGSCSPPTRPTATATRSVISAAWGLGESVVSGAVNTDDIVVDAGTGTVLSSRIADKDVMTVYAEHRTEEQPVPDDQRNSAVLSDGGGATLAAYGTRIDEPLRRRRRTSNGHAPTASSAFCRPDRSPHCRSRRRRRRRTGRALQPTAMYVRASIVEQLPDPLSPLFADMIDGAVTRSLQSLLPRVLGRRTSSRTATWGCRRSTGMPTTATAVLAWGG